MIIVKRASLRSVFADMEIVIKGPFIKNINE